MRIAVIGGGPGGLYLASLAKRLNATHDITVFERRAPGDTFGFGVVLSDETLGGIEHADPQVYAAMRARFARWDDIDVHYRGSVITSGGHGFAAMSRRELLDILQKRCRRLGVALRFGRDAPGAAELAREYDLVVGADGLRSATRQAFADVFQPRLTRHRCRYIWLGTDMVFDAFRFHIVRTDAGVMQLHGYPYSERASTFIVEMREEVWRRAGLDRADPLEACRELFADVLDGHTLSGNGSRWTVFTTVRNETWRHGNVVLLGDAAHTAHFSIGSGTKLAMEDALALAVCLHEREGVEAALAIYEAERRPVVASTQRAARASLEWFEDVEQYVGQPPLQFAFNLLTRSRRVTHGNLRLRDPEFTREVERARGVPSATPPMFTPFTLRGLTLCNRVVVSAMDMYSAVDGTPTDFHLVHLGARALGGAGLVMTEMVCVSATGRITPGCAGMYTPEHEEAWRRVVEFAHRHAEGVAVGLQLGHSGRKGSTRRMWEGIDEPLPEGNWPIVAPSPLPYLPGVSQVPHELTAKELAVIRAQFTRSAEMGARAGFDLLELHCAHGYLLSSFLSPLTNRRTDAYGGSLDARLRYPLEVFDAVRAVWPRKRPVSVRISATDWAEGGVTGDDAVEIARAFAERGADVIDVSTGQVTPQERPEYGRSYQTPFADRIRNTVQVPVIAVGAISSYDDVNSLVLAGRADLCALARPHLYDPNWTLHAAAEQGYVGPAARWPAPYQAGSRPPRTGRVDGPRPPLQRAREDHPMTRHTRWRPST